jgi:hypothetical protein
MELSVNGQVLLLPVGQGHDVVAVVPLAKLDIVRLFVGLILRQPT